MFCNCDKDKIEGVLMDFDKFGNERPWKEKKLKTLQLAESYIRLGMKKGYRVMECSTYLKYKKLIDETEKKLKDANFCRVRLCPMCSWRRSKKIYGQTSKVMTEALKDKNYRFIFLTLTVKNVYGDDLSLTLDNMFKGFNRMFQRAIIKKSIIGWFRALEVTHNLDETSKDYDTYHPHFHIILMVNNSYFNDKKYYISQEKWTSLWQESMRLDYTPIVNVKAFKTATKDKMAKSLAETAKYTVKDGDYLTDDVELTDASVLILDRSLANRRLVAFGGRLKEIHKTLNLDDIEDGDLVNTGDDEELREDVNYMIEVYHWHVGFRQYVKLKD